MTFIIGLLTFALVLDCIALVFLVLIQLPKKEAGIGVAFGGGATDALFGAGSGNVLTKATKYAAVVFFGLAVLTGILQSHNSRVRETKFQSEVLQQSQQTPALMQPAPAPAAVPAAAPLVSQPAATPTVTPEAPAAK